MKLADYNRLAESIAGAPVLYRMAVTSVHGMNTRGAWQKKINTTLQDVAIRHDMVDYGYLVKGVLFKRNIERVADEIVERYRVARVRKLEMGAIAHSYGTLCVGRALEWNPTLSLTRIVFWGCILPCDFDWTKLLQRGQVGAVLNETCVRDCWARIAKYVIRGAGPSGCYGFTPARPEIIERAYEHTEHIRLGTALHSESVWIPFLLTGLAPPA